jgi:lysophospholipase L1-like esterase
VAGTGDPDARGWVGRVAAALPMTAYNLGVRRETSAQVLARWRAEAAPRIMPGADTRVVFSFGANDATVHDGRMRVEPQASVDALREALAGAAELGLPALVVGPPPVADPAHADRIEALAARLAQACSVPFVDVTGALRRSGPWVAEAGANDGAHPGAGGYEQLTTLVLGPLERWVRGPRV